MRPDLFLATIGRGSNGSNALEVTEDRAAVTAESQDNIINRVNNVSQYGPSWHYVPGIGVAGTAYAEVPGSALGDLAFSRASSKTRTNSAGVVETIASNVPPHDYRNADGTLSTFPRLNLEPQRTNSIRNSSMVGAVAGTPGTLPTNWAVTNLSGLTQTIVGTGVENGLPYFDIRYNGTATSTSSIDVRDEANTQIAAANGQSWTHTAYLRLVSAVVPPAFVQVGIYERTSTGIFVVGGFAIAAITSTLQRFSINRTLSGGATVAFTQPLIQFSVTNGVTYDFTIRIAAPQMELGAYATTWVPTTTAAVTRLADAASKTGVSSLIGQTEGTLFVDIVPIDVTTTNAIGINAASTSDRILIFTGSGLIFAQVRVGGISQFNVNTSASVGVRYKAAIAYKGSDFAFYLNGTQIGVSSTGTVPACSVISYDTGTGVSPFVGRNNQAALFPTRLTNAQLAQMTTL